MIPYADFLYFGILLYIALPTLLIRRWLGFSRPWVLLATAAMLVIQYGTIAHLVPVMALEGAGVSGSSRRKCEHGKHHADHGALPSKAFAGVEKLRPVSRCRKDKEHTVSANPDRAVPGSNWRGRAVVPPVWIEQTTCRLQGGCSATELRRRRANCTPGPASGGSALLGGAQCPHHAS